MEKSVKIELKPYYKTVMDFFTNDEIKSLYAESRKKCRNANLFTKIVYDEAKKRVLINHKNIIEWLENLPYYYKSEYNQIFVHSGVAENILNWEKKLIR